MAKHVGDQRRSVVASFSDLLQRRFVDGVNALCWRRTLAGDFLEVAQRLAPAEGLVVVDADGLNALPLSSAGRIAADIMVADMAALHDLGLDPVLNCITTYERDERALPIRTDVLSFHADRAPLDVSTWLCTYQGKPTEGLDNDDARRLIDNASIRNGLLAAYGDVDDEGFVEFLRAGSFDLHFGVADGAIPFSFGLGALWRIAVDWPGCAVPPCIHRAPPAAAGDEPRLLLIC